MIWNWAKCVKLAISQIDCAVQHSNLTLYMYSYFIPPLRIVKYYSCYKPPTYGVVSTEENNNFTL